MPFRYLAAATVALALSVVTAFGTVSEVPEPAIAQRLVVEQLALANRAPEVPASPDFWHEDRFERGDTFAALLDRLGVDESDAARLRREPDSGGALRGLRPGTSVQVRLGSDGELRQLSFVAGRDTLVTIERSGDGFRASGQPVPLERQVMMRTGVIRSSLFAATDASDVPDSVAVQIADIFGGDVDFHRDLRRGDRFEVVYEMYRYAGREVKAGRVLAAEFVSQGRVLRAVWFRDGTGGESGGYYTPEGKNLRKAFLRSPLEFSRISSGFGMRLHPIERRWRAHTGVDYAAPTGTRVKATGDGVIDFAGRQNGYGNVVVVRHAGGYTSWYAHLSRFASGLTRGQRVSQGDIIAFVGQTGWATGPHLHYEFRIHGMHRNPLAIAFPTAQPLSAARLPAFLEHARELVAKLELLRPTNIALLE